MRDIVTAVVLIVTLGCGGGKAKTPPTVPGPAKPAAPPAYASLAAIATPKLFGAGAISTEAPEFAITFTPDGGTAYFDRANAERSKLTIMRSTFADGVWQPAVAVGFSTGEFRDVDPFVTPDGTRLYFSSNRPGAGEGFNTWLVERTEEGWGEPAPLAELAGDPDEVFVTGSSDGTLYYQSNETGGGDIYRVAGEGAPERLSETINTEQGESNPAISPDGKLLVFVAERKGGMGGADLYASHAEGKGWTAPKLLRAASSAQGDFAPSISPDGHYLFFTSERPGVVPAVKEGRPPGDIYQMDLAAALAE